MPTINTINIGLSKESIQGVVSLLNQNLADFYLLLIKTRKYHWDVVGPQFLTLHEIWERQYQILADNIDDCAERIRALGGYPLGTAERFLKHCTLKEHPSDLPNSMEMVQRLVSDHEKIIRNLREHIDLCSEKYHDEGTADFLIGLMKQHEEMAWMLRSFLDNNIATNIVEKESFMSVTAS